MRNKLFSSLPWLLCLGQINSEFFSLVQFSRITQSRPTLCDPMDCSMPASLSITNSQNLLKLMSIDSVMLSNQLTLCHPSPSAFSLSQHQGFFQWVSSSGGQVLEFPASAFVLPGLISFWMDWLDLLAGEETLNSLLQHHSSKASVL